MTHTNFDRKRENFQESYLRDAPAIFFASKPRNTPCQDSAQSDYTENPATAIIERFVFARASSTSVNMLDSLSIQLDLDKT